MTDLQLSPAVLKRCPVFVEFIACELSHSSDYRPQITEPFPNGKNSSLHVGISLRSALKGTLSGSLSGTLADESWKSPLIENKKYN